MSKILYVGDPHVQVSNLEESERLLSFIEQAILSEKPDTLVFLGDQTNNHALLRIEVNLFWTKWFRYLSGIIKTVALVGNHDSESNKMKIHSMEAFKYYNDRPLLNIIDTPTIIDGFGYIPYIHDKTIFLEEANKLCLLGAKVLVCHGEFDGARYESGKMVENGVKYSDINTSLIISGHYHSRQRFANVIYPGTARWITAADANEDKGLWLVEHSEDGSILNERFIDTSGVCTPIISLVWLEGEDQPLFPDNAKVAIELVGSSSWIAKKKIILKGKASIKSKITDKKDRTERKTGNSLEFFMINLYSTKMDKNRLIKC
jgi:predicted phosphodiesterase